MKRVQLTAASTKAHSDGRATTRVIASTDAEDRMLDIVDQSWELGQFRANPVILWGHNYSIPPVGRALSVDVVDGALVAEIEWDTGTELGATVARQFDGGFLSAVSVGFRPGRAVSRASLPSDDPRYREGAAWDAGSVYYDNTLLEISAVAVPANAEALALRGLPPMEDPEAVSLRRALVEMLGEPAIVDQIRAALSDGEEEPPADTPEGDGFWSAFGPDEKDPDWFE